MKKIQYITQDNSQLSHADQALAMYKHGIPWVQLRMKYADESELRREALKIQDYALAHGGQLILNDHVELAKELGIDAVHLGLSDMPIDAARQVLGSEVVIGGTANTYEQLKLQADRGADYVGVGPFRFTTTKKNLSPVLGLAGYEALLQQMEENQLTLPVFAVGGIKINDIADLQKIGVHHFAISGEVLQCHLNKEYAVIDKLLAQVL